MNLIHTGLSRIPPDPTAGIIFTGKHRTPEELHVEKFITEISHQFFFFFYQFKHRNHFNIFLQMSEIYTLFILGNNYNYIC